MSVIQTAGLPERQPGHTWGAEIVRQRACDESVAGFERAYGLTFYAAILALVLGTLLPGWPFAWAGRRAADAPASAAH